MPKKFDIWSTKDALRGNDRKPILLEALKDKAEILVMFMFVSTSNHVKWRCDGSLRNVLRCYRNVLIRPYQIKLCEHTFTSQDFGEIVNMSDRVTIEYSCVVKCTRSSTREPVAVGFWEYVEWRCSWAFWRANYSHPQPRFRFWFGCTQFLG